jgi:hypothetical protein
MRRLIYTLRRALKMLKGSILTLALVVGLIAVAGAAVAAIGSGDDAVVGGESMAVVAPAMMEDNSGDDGPTYTSTTQVDDGDDVEAAAPTTTSGDVDDDGGPMTVAAPIDDDSGADDSMSTTTTTTMGGDYTDDDYDDGYDEYMIPDGDYVVDASPAGSITVVVRDGMIVETQVDIDPVWMLYKFDEKSDEVELGFYWGESELKIKVEIDDGQLKKHVEFDMK